MKEVILTKKLELGFPCLFLSYVMCISLTLLCYLEVEKVFTLLIHELQELTISSSA